MPELDKMLDIACARHGSRPAIRDGDEALSYRAFAQFAEDCSEILKDAGLARDEPVLVAVSNRGRDFASLYGTWKAGGVAVPVHRDASSHSLGVIVERTGARWMLDADRIAGKDGNAEPSPLRQLSETPPPRRDLLRDAAWIVFTSGSTGVPKGVVHAHDTFAAKLDTINASMGLPGEGQVLVPLQLVFAYAHWVALTTLLRGGEVVLNAPFHPETFLNALADGPVAAAVVPTMLRAMRPLIESRDDVDFGGTLMTGGEVLPAELGACLRTRWPGMRLWDVYGLTETATSDFYVRPDDHDRAGGTIGTPAPGVLYRIDGDTGELQIRTPYCMRGYLDAPDLTDEAMLDGYFRTGDQAKETPDGFVQITGRLKDLVNRAGNKISPIEVETAFLEHEGIEQVLAAGVPDDFRGESLHMMVVPASEASLEPEQLRDWASGRLERHKVPDVIHLVSSLPVGSTGKTDRNAMRAQIISGLDGATAGKP